MASAAATSWLGLLGCPGAPPTTGGTTDASATDGAHGAPDVGGADEGADETGAGEEEALRTLERDIEASNPKMVQYEITAARVGLAFPSGSSSTALATPELFAAYVVAYPGAGTTPAVSRRQPVSLSLIAPSPPVPRDDPDGVTDDLGDSRHEAPIRPMRR